MRPVRASSLVDRVSNEIRRSILAGELPPGKPFSIADLSSRLEVSHIPVREALRRLEAQGLVQLRPARSAVVSPLNVEDVRGIYHLRELIEGDLIGRAAELVTDAQLTAADAHLRGMARATPASAGYWEHHEQLHWALLEPAASTWSRRVLDQLWRANDRYAPLAFAPVLAEVHGQAHALEVHGRIIEAMKVRSQEDARRQLLTHLHENEALIVDKLQQMLAVSKTLNEQGDVLVA